MGFESKKNVSINGSDYTFKIDGDDEGNIKLVIDPELETALKTAKTEAAQAKSELETMKGEKESAEQEAAAFRKHFSDEIERFQGEAGLNLKGADKWDEEELKTSKPERLIKQAQRLEKQYLDANPSGQGNRKTRKPEQESEKKAVDSYGQF